MGRPRKNALYPVAIAPSRAAECLGLHRSKIDAAVRAGDLRVYTLGLARRILVCDLIEWVRSWKIAQGRKRHGPQVPE
jgi:excisionase family DNA binding protein